MALAETAQLAVVLTLKDQLSGGVSKAESELAGLNRTAAVSGGAVGTAEKAMGRAGASAITLGGALNHAKGAIGGLLTGPLGMLGLGAGLLSVSELFRSSVGKASEFAFAIEKMQGLTNDSADSLARLIAVTDNYGISADRLSKVIGFTEKALGNVATTAGGAAKFEQQFGFAITDAQGKVLPFNDVLLKAADFYNSSADQSTKAALAAKLFGRSYADLVPILKLGSQGIRDAEQAAGDLGITLNQTNVQDLARYREATRELGDAVTGLQLQIGLALVPAFTELARSAKSFIADNRTQIVGFFRDAARFAAQVGDAITTVVIPAFSAIGRAWDLVPGPLKELLIGGFVANKALKFTLGFGLGDIAKMFTGSGGLFSRGSTPANPLFVSDVTGGISSALGLGEAGLGFLAPGALAAAVAVAVPLVMGYLPRLFPGQAQAGAGAGSQPPLTIPTSQGSFTLTSQQHAMMVGLMPSFDRSAFGAGATLTKEAMAALTEQQMRQVASHAASEHAELDAMVKNTASVVAVLDTLHTDLQTQLGVLRTSKDPAALAAAAAQTAKDVLAGAGGVTSTSNILARLQAARAGVASGSAEAKIIDAAIRAVGDRLDGRRWIAAQEAAARKIVASNEPVKQKLSDLKAIDRELLGKGDKTAAAIVEGFMKTVAAVNATTAAVAGLGGHGFSPIGTTPVVSAQTGFTLNVHATTTDRSNVISRTKAQRWSTVRSMAQ